MPKIKPKQLSAEDLPRLIARLADQYGVTPADVAGHPPCAAALKGVQITPIVIHAARVLWRADIDAILDRVDARNNAVIKSSPEYEGYQSRRGVVSLPSVASAPMPPPANKVKPKAVAPVRSNGCEILGSPATAVLRLLGKLGFPFADARLAMDELGGRGISDVTVRLSLSRWQENHVAQISDEQLAELKSFRGKGVEQGPKPKPVKQVITQVAMPARVSRFEFK